VFGFFGLRLLINGRRRESNLTGLLKTHNFLSVRSRACR
jgi:hypothetical protein